MVTTTSAAWLGVLALAMPAAVSATSVQPVVLPSVSISVVAAVEAEMGLSPLSAVLCDFTQAELAAVRTSLRQSVGLQLLLSARTSIVALTAEIAGLKESGGGEVGQSSQQLAAAQASLVTARSAAESARAQVLADMQVAVPSSKWEVFVRIRAAPAGLPPEMRVLNWSSVQLVALSKALIQERRAIQGLVQISSEDALLLASARTDPHVASASQRVSVGLAAMEAAMRNQPN